MDVLAHFLWGLAAFWSGRHRWWAGIISVLPDIVFLPIITLELSHLGGTAPAITSIPKYVMTLYGITHSLVVWFVVFGAAWLYTRRLPTLLLAWALHILIDIPTHPLDYLPTPFLWPLSNYYFEYGIHWSTPLVLILNYSLLAVTYLALYYRASIMSKKAA